MKSDLSVCTTGTENERLKNRNRKHTVAFRYTFNGYYYISLAQLEFAEAVCQWFGRVADRYVLHEESLNSDFKVFKDIGVLDFMRIKLWNTALIMERMRWVVKVLLGCNMIKNKVVETAKFTEIETGVSPCGFWELRRGLTIVLSPRRREVFRDRWRRLHIFENAMRPMEADGGIRAVKVL